MKYARPDGDPRLTSSLLVKRGVSRWVAGDMPGACLDGETAYKLNEADFSAFQLLKYSCGPGPGARAGSQAARKEQAKRVAALQDDTIAHTHEEWAERQERNPTPSGSLSLKAIRAHRKGDLGAAMSFADGAVKADPDDPMARFQRGYLRGETKDYNGAITDLTGAITLGWKDKVLFKLRGEALLMAGRYAAALEDAEMAVALSPDYAEAYYLRATAKMQAGRPIGETLADLKKAAELAPGKFGDFYRKTKKDFAGMESARPGAAASVAAAPARRVLMVGNGTVKVMDFGLARTTRGMRGNTQTSMVAGTPAYMAPEVYDGRLSREADLYALGVSLYEMLVGRLPFQGGLMLEDKLAGRFAAVSTYVPETSGLHGFFQKALAPKTENRFHSAGEFFEGFQLRAG